MLKPSKPNLERVLMVDDDPMLLSSMERCLGLKFDLSTATSGAEAISLMEQAAEPFPVVLTDMRMPAMDGVQFIERARRLSEHTIYLMLTGNQDTQTAIQAVNKGQVFRFLNKPSSPEDITEAIDAGINQYRLEQTERELLNKTFVGALGIFGDIIEILQPELQGRAGRTEQFVEELCQHCRTKLTWEYKIAAKLSLVGHAMHPISSNTTPTSDEAKEQLLKACTSASRVVERIPRLQLVAEIIRAAATTEGELPVLEARGDADTVQIGASMLRVAQLLEFLSHVGLDQEQAERELQRILPDIDQNLLAAAGCVYPVAPSVTGIPVEIGDLIPGMILQDNLSRPDGAVLLRAGRRLSQTHIDKLEADARLGTEFPPIIITEGSFEAAASATTVG